MTGSRQIVETIKVEMKELESWNLAQGYEAKAKSQPVNVKNWVVVVNTFF